MKEMEVLMIEIELTKPWNKILSYEEIRNLYKISINFTEFTKNTNDLRFFNTTLKINDFLRNQKKIFSIDEIKYINRLENELIKDLKEKLLK